MEELGSSNFRILLSIKEGKGFDQILEPTTVVATLNGHSLETEAIEPSPEPQYAHDLVWEVDKNKLRKMRSGQVPLKLECFALKENDNREKLGYLLLSIRCAQIISKNSTISVKTNWHKLLGLKNDLKADKPELLIALSVHEQEPVISNAQLELNSEDYRETGLKANTMIPILLHDERLIQLGPLNTCRDLFLLNITAISATNINLLLPDEVHTNVKDDLNVWCQILENNVHFNPLLKDSKDVWMLNEKIVVRIRTSLGTLRKYLRLKPHLFIYLKYKENIVGQSEVDLQPLIPTDDIQEFLKITTNSSTVLDRRCFLYKKGQVDKEYTNTYFDFQVTLQYVGVKTDLTTEYSNTLINMTSDVLPSDSNPTKTLKNNFGRALQNTSEIDCHRNPGGDFGTHSTGTYTLHCTNVGQNINKHCLSCDAMRDQPIKMTCSHSAEPILCQCNNTDCSKSVEAYHYYCLNVTLVAIKLLPSKLTTPYIEIRFHHPKSDITSSFSTKVALLSGEKVKLQDIGCKLHFISTIDEIHHLLLCFPPKISIYDVGKDSKTCISHTILDVKRLLHQNKSEDQYDIPLYDMQQIKIGTLDSLLRLEDHGPYYRINKRVSNQNWGPPILDDSLAYKIVDELETWKERQKEIFKVELKRKEERHLNLLSEEWQKHRENLESKLACSVEQCKMLANSLNNATEDLRTRRLKSLEKEARLIQANEDLQWRYEMKLQELKESFQKMQEELMAKINILEKKKTVLEAQIEPLSAEHEKLRLLVGKQSQELETFQKGSLTQDQTANLLQELKALEEKLHNAQESKSFFKEQWAKAVREIHRMKTEHQQAIQVQIKTSKEELQNLDLEEILCADSTALTNDQILLGQIQKEIDVIKPKPTLTNKDTYNQVFTPSAGIKVVQNNNVKGIPKKSEEHVERLQALIEERDSLLKTGSYTIDDAVIIQLNTEIRSLMMR